MTLASDLEVAASAWVVILSAALLFLSVAAYRRSRTRRMLGLTAAFALFLAKGVIISLSLFNLVALPTLPLTPVFDTAILLSLYLATLRAR